MSKNKLASSNISININKLAQIVVKELKKDNYIFNVLNIYEWPPKGKKLDGNETSRFKRKMCGRFASIIDKENKNPLYSKSGLCSFHDFYSSSRHIDDAS